MKAEEREEECEGLRSLEVSLREMVAAMRERERGLGDCQLAAICHLGPGLGVNL